MPVGDEFIHMLWPFETTSAIHRINTGLLSQNTSCLV